MSSGTFIAFFGSAFRRAKPIRQLSSTNFMFQKGIAAAEDIFKQIDETPEKDFGSKIIKNSEGKIKFDNVSLKYSSSKEYSLKNINFELEKGSNLAIVGSSGAGKSSIINLIPRFYDATEGGIFIDGIRIEELSLESLRDQISYVGQEITLFNDTIFNNIFYGDIDTSEEDVYEAAKKANAHQFIESFPDGYKTVIGDNGTLLSGGQKQRIAIARAILKKFTFFNIGRSYFCFRF
jgi:ABC-type multidrug transport system, ATPase and permease components